MKYKIVKLEELPNIDENTPLYFDLETDVRTDSICLAQFYSDDWEEVYLVKKPDPYKLLFYVLGKYLIIHNASFELVILSKNTKQVFKPNKFEDTMLLSRYSYPKQESASFDNVSNKVHGKDYYAEAGLDKKKLQNSDWNLISPDMEYYAALDVYLMRGIWDKLKKNKDVAWYNLMKKGILNTLKMSMDGMMISIPAVEKLLSESIKTHDDLNLPVNSKSYQKCLEYIGLDYIRDTSKLTLLEQVIVGNKKCDKIYKARAERTKQSRLNKWLKLNKNGVITGKYAPTNVSGRFNCSDKFLGDNLQNTPKDLRDVFIPRDGNVFLYSDFSNLELRCFCAYIGEKVMEKAFKEGLDLHSNTASFIFGKDYTDRERFIGKQMNFSLLYGMGYRGFREKLIVDALVGIVPEQARIYRERWLDYYPQIRDYHERGKIASVTGELWSTPMGLHYNRRTTLDSVGRTIKFKANEQLNICIQGFGAEVACKALEYKTESIERAGLSESVEIRNFSHDGYIWEVVDNPDVIKETADIIKKDMVRAWVYVCDYGAKYDRVKIPDLPMPVEVVSAYSWGDIEKGKGVKK